MSRRTTKQRRAALWRKEWCATVREHRASTPRLVDPGWWDDVAPLCADYGQSFDRRQPPWGFGLRVPASRRSAP